MVGAYLVGSYCLSVLVRNFQINAEVQMLRAGVALFSFNPVQQELAQFAGLFSDALLPRADQLARLENAFFFALGRWCHSCDRIQLGGTSFCGFVTTGCPGMMQSTGQ